MPLIMNGTTIPTNVANVLNYNGTNITSVIFNGTNVWTQSLNFTANLTISAHTTYYNIRTALINAGWNQSVPVVATVTVNSGIYVYATSTGSYAMETGSLPSGSSLTIVNNGYIIGKGGDAVKNTNGNSGGPALNINYPCSITNNSYIAGGGGAGGGADGGGGAGGGSGTYGGGGGIGASGGSGGNFSFTYYKSYIYRGYGAGGGRILPGSGGAGFSYGAAGGGGAGGGGGCTNAATQDARGGSGGSANNGGASSSGGMQQTTENGGGGGGWGAAGGTGYYAWAAKGGGSGGKAVNLNGNSVTWLATGNRYGTIS